MPTTEKRFEPADSAAHLERAGGDEARAVVSSLPPDESGALLEELRDDLGAQVLAGLPHGQAAAILDTMSPNESADVLALMDDSVAHDLLLAMSDERAAEVSRLLMHHPESAGGLMTTDIASLPAGISVSDAMERIRSMRDDVDDLSYVYVVDDGGLLVGVVSFRDLVFRRPTEDITLAMTTPAISVTVKTDRETITDLVARYHLMGIPVTDVTGRLVGMVTADEVLRAARAEASEDFAVAVGTAAEDSVYVPVSRSVLHRLPWISFDLILSTLVVVAVAGFSDFIASFVVLAALMPLVARIGGDAGAQTLAVVIRGLAGDGIPRGDVRRILTRESLIGLINGLVIGLMAGLLGFVVQTVRAGPDKFGVGLAMFFAAWANLSLAGFFGAAVPLGLRRVGLDPALGSNLFLTTFTDLLGFGGFLAVASLLL